MIPPSRPKGPSRGAPHCTPLPGCATREVPGVSVRVVDEHGDFVEPGKQGFIVVDKIGPSMARTVWGDRNAT